MPDMMNWEASKHRSHISGQKRYRGWTRAPSKQVRQETRDYQKQYQAANCTGCRFAILKLIGTGRQCCAYEGALKTEPGKCLTREGKDAKS